MSQKRTHYLKFTCIKGGLISESFSIRFKSSIEGAKSLREDGGQVCNLTPIFGDFN